MKGSKMLYAGIAVMVLCVGFMFGTYAYYQSTMTGTASGNVLAWDCESGTTVSSTAFKNLYPGGSGTAATFKLTCSIAADYTITINTLTNMGTGSNHPNLNLYTDSAYSDVINASDTITGSISAGTATTKSIYYKWPYGTSAETYSSAAPAFTYTITFTQK